MEQYNDPKQVVILSESSNILAPKKLYTSDLHIGHKNIIGFDHRPFNSLDDKRLCLVIRKLNYYQGEYDPWCLYSVSEVSTFKK